MKAVLLVGGRGTRLRPLTFAVPKPLIAIGDKPMLQYTIERLRDSGVDELMLATGYLADLIETFCGDGSRFGVRITYHREAQPLGTAGPLSLMRDRIDPDESFILMNGDIVADLDYADFVSYARTGRWLLTVGVVEHTYKSPYGVLNILGDEVLDIVEKPEVKYPISAGIYVLNGRALEHIPDGKFFTVPNLIHALQATGLPVGAYRLHGFWTGVEELTHVEAARTFMDQSVRAAAK